LVISVLQQDDLQTPEDNTTVAAQSWVIHQLSLSDEAQITPERSLPTYEKLRFQQEDFLPLSSTPATHYLVVCSKFTFPPNAAQTLTLHHCMAKKASRAHHSFLSPLPARS